MDGLKITITNIEKYIANNIVVFEVEKATGVMEADFRNIYEAFDYLNWYHNNEEYRLVFSSIEDNSLYNSIKDLVNSNYPLEIKQAQIKAVIGTIEFTEKHLGKEITALNIPTSLRDKEFTGRYISEITSDEIGTITKLGYSELFIKDAYRTKKTTPFIFRAISKFNEDMPRRILVSEVVGFIAEYRAFIYKGEILDCRQYLGDYKVRYNVDKLEKMVAQWENKPTACTLDIGVLSNGDTVVIEAHNFLCCGLYGFNGDKLAYMILKAYLEEKVK